MFNCRGRSSGLRRGGDFYTSIAKADGDPLMLEGISARPHCDRALEITVSKRNHPQMAARFRLVKYYDLSRFMLEGII